MERRKGAKEDDHILGKLVDHIFSSKDFQRDLLGIAHDLSREEEDNDGDRGEVPDAVEQSLPGEEFESDLSPLPGQQIS